MIAQNFLSFFITIGSYNNHYLDYIFGPGTAPVVPPRGGDGQKGFLQVQEFGPFYASYRRDMQDLRDIVLYLMIWQMEGTREGVLIKDALDL